MIETSNLIANAKENYYQNEGKKLLNISLGPKKYWSILNIFLGNKKIPIIPPLFDNGEIVADYLSKAEIFNDFFASQCTPFDETDVVPCLQLRTQLKLSSVIYSKEKIVNIIRALDPSKSSGYDGLSPQMIKVCDSSMIILKTFTMALFLTSGRCQMCVQFIKKTQKIVRKIIDQSHFFLS